ncbi:LysM peptidoglycan-binding domain-containing protein [Fusobacterium sp. MFO224]|uniref:LysM peptidoglycan-binding domain-containing protein n=1 Tax=Fusobacterium sp. MFO224 TaxID=3378070 RepID=UPI003852582E
MKKIICVLLMGVFLGCSQIDNLKLKVKDSKEIDYNVAIINTAKGQGVLNQGIGYSRVSTIIKRAEKKYGEENVIYLDAGGNFSGSDLADQTKGSSSVTVFNGIKLKATTLGKEDFKFGLDNLLKIKDRSNFKIITTNIKKKDGNLFLDPYLIEKVGDKKIGIIGLISPEFAKNLKESDNEKIEIEEPVASANLAIEVLKKQKVDFIVVLSSLGNNNKINNRWTSGGLAEEINGIDLIIESNWDGQDSFDVENTVIVSSKEKLGSVGIVQLDLNANKKNKNRINYKTVELRDINVKTPFKSEEEYLVKKGDTLYSLARRNNVEVDELLRINPKINDGKTIKIGEKYLIPSSKQNFDNKIKKDGLNIIEDEQVKRIIEKIN